jgi:hypothetical protein
MIRNPCQQPLADPAGDTSQVLSFFAFVRGELSSDLEQLLPSLEALADPCASKQALIAKRSAQRLRLFSDIAQALGCGLGRGDRILLHDLLTQQCRALQTLSMTRNVEIKLLDAEQQLGPVYGNAHWLGLALRGYLARQIRTVPAGARIVLELRQSGVFKLITSRWHVPTQVMAETCMPANGEDELPIALCRTVIEVLGGRVHLLESTLEHDEIDELGGFVISLPTGASVTQDWNRPCPYPDCLVRQQNNQYALDMGRLLADQDHSSKA